MVQHSKRQHISFPQSESARQGFCAEFILEVVPESMSNELRKEGRRESQFKDALT